MLGTQDNRASIGLISPPSDNPMSRLFWWFYRVTESARKNAGASPIANCKYSTCWIFTVRNPNVWNPEGKLLSCTLSCETKQYPIRTQTQSWRGTKLRPCFLHLHDFTQTLFAFPATFLSIIPNTIIAISSSQSPAVFILKSREISSVHSRDCFQLKICSRVVCFLCYIKAHPTL